MPKPDYDALVKNNKPAWAKQTESRVNKADIKFEYILIDNLILNPNNKNYNANDNNSQIPFEELVASIKLVGIRQPLDVAAMDGNKYMIISGERRYLAAKEAKLKLVPCVIKSAETQTIQTIAKNVTNLMVRELSVEQKYRGYCEIRDAIEAEGKTIDDPEYSDLFKLVDKKAKKLFKKFDTIRRLTSDEDYILFLKGEKSYSNIEESAMDMEQAIKLTKRVNELYRLYAETKEDIEMVIYADEDGYIFYVSFDDKIQKYVVMERDYSKNVESHLCRSSYLPPCKDKKTMQAFLDRYAVMYKLSKVDENRFDSLVSDIKGIGLIKSELVLDSSNDESAGNNPELDSDTTITIPSVSITEATVGTEKDETHIRKPLTPPIIDNKGNIDNGLAFPESTLTVENSEEEQSIETQEKELPFCFEGEELSSDSRIKGLLAKNHDRYFIIRGNINLGRAFNQRGVPSYGANCVVVEVKPESVKMISG